MTTSTFGSSIKRRENPKLITGQGTFVDDIQLVGYAPRRVRKEPPCPRQDTQY